MIGIYACSISNSICAAYSHLSHCEGTLDDASLWILDRYPMTQQELHSLRLEADKNGIIRLNLTPGLVEGEEIGKHVATPRKAYIFKGAKSIGNYN